MVQLPTSVMGQPSEAKAMFDEKLKIEERCAEQIPEKEAAWEKEKASAKPNLDVKMAYAYVLCKSGSERHKILGIRLMQELVNAKFSVEECQYSVAEAFYSMGQYQKSRETVDQLLRRNPEHRYANQLHEILRETQAKEDLVVGAVTAGGVLLGVGALVIGLLAARPRR